MSKPPREMASELSKMLKRIQPARNDQRKDISVLNEAHSQLRGEDDVEMWYKVCDTNQRLYEKGVEELTQLDAALGKIMEIVKKREAKIHKRKSIDPVSSTVSTAAAYAKRQKAARASMTGPELRANGDIWFHEDILLETSSKVAALIDANSKPKIWILASIGAYNGGGGRDERARYEVVDDDEESAGEKQYRKRYQLHPSKVIPLPPLDVVPLAKRKVFQRGSRVLAVFPDTTVLYPCNVTAPPKKGKESYTVVFDDDDDRPRSIRACRVAPLADEFYE